jgi:hypothetical protein
VWTKRNTSFGLTLVAALSILSEGCGGGSSNNSISPAQAQAVTDQVVQALTESLGNALQSTAATGTRPSLSAAVGSLSSDTSSGCTSTSSGENCNWPISLMGDPCTGPAGGTISVTGDIDGTLNNSGAGSVTGQFTITPTNCSVSNLIINGDPSISVGGQIAFTANITPTFPITFTETGGITYGPNPKGSCQLNATYTINSLSSCTVSGTVCGQSVSGSC